jgi:hydroxymethylglutaryl-CoA reductase
MIKGFSRLSKEEKRSYILKEYLKVAEHSGISDTSLSNEAMTQLLDNFSENVISVHPFPYSVAPNFIIDGKEYIVPFVTEESSVVAAAAKSAKYWADRGGFYTELIGEIKQGHVHFKSDIPVGILIPKLNGWKNDLLEAVAPINDKMLQRGGGLTAINLVNKTESFANYYQLEVSFNTCNAMGANFMNSCLEGIASKFIELIHNDPETSAYYSTEIIMSILSNYSPDNAINIWVECPVSKLDDGRLGMPAKAFAAKFCEAVEIARVDVSRAVTHNKGMYNGIDSVALATGNDWRAIEANGHAYASESGQYRSLSNATVEKDIFRFEATLPMQVGTVGGITTLHPTAKLSLDILGRPGAVELMKIMAAAGLASNFAAVRALTTTGIQKGHMKMHLSNILVQMNASNDEKIKAEQYFADKTISNAAVEAFLNSIRK